MGHTPSSIIRSNRWFEASRALAQECSHYLDKQGNADQYHLLHAAYKLNYPEITDENLDVVIAALRAYGIARKAEEDRRKARRGKPYTPSRRAVKRIVGDDEGEGSSGGEDDFGNGGSSQRERLWRPRV